MDSAASMMNENYHQGSVNSEDGREALFQFILGSLRRVGLLCVHEAAGPRFPCRSYFLSRKPSVIFIVGVEGRNVLHEPGLQDCFFFVAVAVQGSRWDRTSDSSPALAMLGVPLAGLNENSTLFALNGTSGVRLFQSAGHEMRLYHQDTKSFVLGS